jgi:glycosyltransferase involved in cell wall biosynthesis
MSTSPVIPDSLPFPASPSALRLQPPMILHVRVCAGNGGGPDKTILRSVRYINSERFRIAAAYLHPKHDPGAAVIRSQAAEFDCPLYQIPERGPIDLFAVRKLLHLIRSLRVTIWHAHDYKSDVLGLILRRFWPMKLVTTVHGFTRETPRTRLYYHIDNLALRGYDRVIAVSPPLMEHCRKLGVPDDRLHYIPNAIDTADYQRQLDTAAAKRDLGIEPDVPIIGCVGRFSPEKGVDRAIRALAKVRQCLCPTAQLHLVGDGPQRAHIQQLIRDLNLTDHVKLWGWQTAAKRFYETMDLLLLPSYTEGLPNAVLEAMALGVPVAATDVGGVRDLLDDGHAGVILSQRDSTWAPILAELLHKPAVRATMARRSRQRIQSHFNFQQRMDRVADLYASLLSIPRPRAQSPLRQAA